MNRFVLLAVTTSLLSCSPASHPIVVEGDHTILPIGSTTTCPAPSVVATNSASASPSIPVPQSHVIMIVGDSEACAMMDVADDVSKERSRLGMPSDELHFRCLVGSHIQYWAAGHLISATATVKDLDRVVVVLGGNHVGLPLPDMKPIIAQLTALTFPCTWAGNAAVLGKRWETDDLLRAAVSSTCDYYSLQDHPVKLPDGMHPDAAGARLWLNDILNSIHERDSRL